MELDDKLQIVMEKFNAKKDKATVQEIDDIILPPTSVEEFEKAEKLSEWPFRLTSENPLELEEERMKYANRETILDALAEASCVDTTVLDKLEHRLDDLYGRLSKFADMIFVVREESPDETQESHAAIMPPEMDEENVENEPRPDSNISIKSARSPEMRNKAFMTDVPETDLHMVHPSKKAKKFLGIKESLVETKKKGVENCVFPGFQEEELTELPGNMEAPQILNRVTSAASFSSGFKKYWKKIFQSEASVAIMKDSFWWIFLEYFQKRKRAAQDKLFDRVADSFVALFTSIHPEVKDKFFKVYSDCLAQSIFVAFNEAFPESDQHFDREDFKQLLTNTVSEWVTGVRAPARSWKKWPLDKLDLAPYQAPEEVHNGSKIDLTAMARGLSFHLDMDGFVKTINKLEDQDHTHTVDLGPSGSNLPVVKITSASSNLATTVPTAVNSSTGLKQTPRESHPVGRGAEVERVLFNLSGQSPLIAHYQRTHQMKHIPSMDRYIRRTEMTKPPPNTKTYRDLIEETKAHSKAMHNEYDRITETTKDEIAKIERQQRELSKAIDNLKLELATTKNIPEVKLKSDKLFEKGVHHIESTMSISSGHRGQASNSHSSDSVVQ